MGDSESQTNSPDHEEQSILMEPKREGEQENEQLIFKEYPAATNKKRRAWVINGLILLFLAVLATSIVVVITLTRKDSHSSHLRYAFDDMFNASLKSKSFSLLWMSVENEDYYVHWNKSADTNESLSDINVVNPKTGDVELLVPASIMEELNATSFSVSADMKYVLLISDVQMIYRHSFNATYHLYENSTGNVTEVRPLEGEGQLQYVVWSPVGHSLAFVQNYDVYVWLDFDQQPTQLTTDGSDLIDGIPDWVYEEEVLSTNHALWWSYDNSYVCYISFNDSNVMNFHFPHYGDFDNVYTDIYSVAYPKAGKSNPTVTVTVVNTADKDKLFQVHAPLDVTSDHLVMSVTWAGNSEQLAVVWMNRVQNTSVISLCNASSETCRNFYSYQSNAWLDNVPLVFSLSGRYLSTLMSSFNSTADDNFTHIALFDTTDDIGSPKFITSGMFVVTRILKFSSDLDVLYYVSTEDENGVGVPRQRHLWSVKTSWPYNKQCVSCSTSCKYSSADFSVSGEWYMLLCAGPEVPSYSLHNVNSTDIVVLEGNFELKELLQNFLLPQTEFFHVYSDHVPQGFEAVRLLPPNFETSKKYPVLFEVYGGPGSQKVSEVFYLGWKTYLASNLDIVVIMLDGRGTGYRGDRFMHAVYHQLGCFETNDVIDGARQLKSSTGYLDPNKFAIWGWSFGGYLSSMVAGSGSKEFQTAVAVAPVTSWKYYDSVYTERYNGLPSAEDNLNGYEAFNVTSRAANFTEVDYLLVHGTGDDNVHFQNTAQLLKALTEAEVDYRVQFYTDKQHSLGGEVTHRHLYHLLTEFLKEKLRL